MTNRVDQLEWELKKAKAELDYLKAEQARYVATIASIYALRRWRVIQFTAKLKT